MNPSGKPATGQQNTRDILTNSHRRSSMNAVQVQDYIDLVVSKVQIFGEHYVARQLEWAVVELELAGEIHRYEVAQ